MGFGEKFNEYLVSIGEHPLSPKITSIFNTHISAAENVPHVLYCGGKS